MLRVFYDIASDNIPRVFCVVASDNMPRVAQQVSRGTCIRITLILFMYHQCEIAV